MPDLIPVAMQQCISCERAVTIGAYILYLSLSTGWVCECKAYKFSKPNAKGCKHVDQHLEEMCGWHELVGDPAQTELQKERHECPKCGQATMIVMVGV